MAFVYNIFNIFRGVWSWGRSNFVHAEVTLTEQPWREQVCWDDEQEQKIKTEIEALSPKIKPNILFIGPVGAGKSAFINSVLSVAKGRKVDYAQTGSDEMSYTRKYDKYTHATMLQNYRLNDCMGIESTTNRGCLEEDIKLVLEGHIRQKYRFNPNRAIDTESNYFRKIPQFKHQIHCVVFVIDARVMRIDISPDYVQKIRSHQRIVQDHDIHRVLILTKADTLCTEVERDITKLYRSIRVRDAVRVASDVFGIPLASIHPVVNFEIQPTLGTQRNIQVLMPLKQILEYAEDRIEKKDMNSESD